MEKKMENKAGEKTAVKDQKEQAKLSIEVCLPDGSIKKYEGYEALRADILSGAIKKDYKARLANAAKGDTWATVEKVSRSDFSLRSLYQPVWAYTMKYLAYGVIAGAILKGIDTTLLFFMIDPLVGFLWLFVVASLFLSRWIPWLPVVAILVSLRCNINLYLTLLGVMFIGAFFGGPAGMAVGTVVGHIRRRNSQRAPDAVYEGKKPYLFGLVTPVVFLSVTLPLYIFWMTPKLFNMLSNGS